MGVEKVLPWGVGWACALGAHACTGLVTSRRPGRPANSPRPVFPVSGFQFPVSSFQFPVSSFRFQVSGSQPAAWHGRSTFCAR